MIHLERFQTNLRTLRFSNIPTFVDVHGIGNWKSHPRLISMHAQNFFPSLESFSLPMFLIYSSPFAYSRSLFAKTVDSTAKLVSMSTAVDLVCSKKDFEEAKRRIFSVGLWWHFQFFDRFLILLYLNPLQVFFYLQLTFSQKNKNSLNYFRFTF